MSASVGQRLAAESTGSALLLAAIVGSGIMAERLSGGNVAIALLGNTLSTVAMLVVLVTIFAPVSGAHFNPAVTLVMLVRRETSVGIALAYFAAQFLGAVAGTAIAHMMYELPALTTGVKPRVGPAQWLGEGVATFALIVTILGTARFHPQRMAASVGAVIAAGYWFTSSTSFANPAVTVARAMTASFSGIRPGDVPAFVAAQLAGALVAAALSRWIFAAAHSAD